MNTRLLFFLFAVLTLFLFTTQQTQAQQKQVQAAPSLETFLHEDGTLKLPGDYQGRLDTKGWTMELGPEGDPRFEPRSAEAEAADENWIDQFGRPGVAGVGYAVAIDGSKVYVGGSFTFVGDVESPGIAIWDTSTQTWSSMGGGVKSGTDPGFVTAIEVSGNNVYIGGGFTTAGSTPANYIAMWDKSSQSWSAMGAGTSDYVLDIKVVGSNVFIGGWFTLAGGKLVNNVARWDGTTWNPLGTGTNGDVWGLEVIGDQLYAGGSFATFNNAFYQIRAAHSGKCVDVSGVSPNPGAGIHQWECVGVSGANQIWAMQPVGSNFRVVAKHSGLCLTVPGADTGTVQLVQDNCTDAPQQLWELRSTSFRDLYQLVASHSGKCVDIEGSGTDNGTRVLQFDCTGDFNQLFNLNPIDGTQANNVARWDGTTWNALTDGGTTGTDNTVFDLSTDGAILFLGGAFTNAGGKTANRIANWNPSSSTFAPLGSGFNNTVYSLATVGNIVYASGQFSTSGIADMNQISRWNGSGWSTLQTGLQGGDGFNLGMVASGSGVYVAGSFALASGKPVSGVAQWTGTTWSALGDENNSNGLFGTSSGLNATAGRALEFRSTQDDVYVGGVFQAAGAVPANSIARWNVATKSWVALGEGLVDANGNPGTVRSIVVNGDNIYVGGFFTMAGSVPANNIAVWNTASQSWSALGTGTNGPVYAIVVAGSSVFAGGTFTTAGGTGVNNVARWDGSTWNALAGGLVNNAGSSEIWAMEIIGDQLYAGGQFNTSGGGTFNNVARWDGTTWHALIDGTTNGTDGPVYDLISDGSNLNLAGAFVNAGGKTVNRVARWNVAGNSFSALGSGFNGPWVSDLTMAPNGTLYAGGAFTQSGINSRNRVAFFNGTSWEALGSGTSGSVFGLSVGPGNDLYVGGSFSQAGGKTALGIARYNLAANTASETLTELPETLVLEQNYPNPFNPSTRIAYEIPEAGQVTVRVLDMLGREVALLVNKSQSAGRHTVAFRADHLASGLYFYRIEAGALSQTRRMVLLK